MNVIYGSKTEGSPLQNKNKKQKTVHLLNGDIKEFIIINIILNLLLCFYFDFQILK